MAPRGRGGTTAAQRTLAVGSARRVALLDSPYPVLFVETTPGAGARALIDEWATVEDSPELRVVVAADKIVARGADLFRAVAQQVRAALRSAGAIPQRDRRDSPSPEEPAATLLALLRRAHRQLVVAVTAADYLDADGFAELLQLLVARDRARLIVAAMDASELMGMTRRSDVPYARLDDGDLTLDRDEVRAMLRHAGLASSTSAVTTVYHRTRGLLGVVRAAIDRAVAQRVAIEAVIAGAATADIVTTSSGGAETGGAETGGADTGGVAAGSADVGSAADAQTADAQAADAQTADSRPAEPAHLQRALPQPAHLQPALVEPGAVGEYLVARDAGSWPSPLVRFTAAMAHVPRFTALQASAIADVANPRVLIARLVALRLGETAFHAGLRQPIFTWFEPARIAALRYLPASGNPQALLRRTADAARSAFDGELLVMAYVSMGQMADAEEHLASWWWDVVPSEFSPLWEPLRALGLDELADYPYLTYLRLRIDPRGPKTPAGLMTAAAVAESLASRQLTRSDPWERLMDLAVQADLARVRGDLPGMTQPVARARSLASDLLGGSFVGASGRQGVSALLLLAEGLFRVRGNATAAAEFAGYALDLLDVGRSLLDPHEHGRGFASRLLLVAARERGLPDPPDAAEIVAGPQFRWRDADIAAQGLATMWERIDAGDDAGAARACQEATRRVADASLWPGLWYPQVALAHLTQRDDDLHVLMRHYRHACETVGLRPTVNGGSPPVLPDINDALGRAVLPPDAGLATVSDAGADARPRWRYHHELLSALTALREGRGSLARRHLERACEVAERRPLSPTMLAVARPEEVDELQRIIADHPLAGVLRLDHARGMASGVPHVGVPLSDREQQVLELMRAGMTNKQMAAELYVSVNTIKFHRGNVMRKLGASTRQQALEAAAKAGL